MTTPRITSIKLPPSYRRRVATAFLGAGLLVQSCWAQTAPNAPRTDFVAASAATAEPKVVRPEHLWTKRYIEQLWNDTRTVLTAPTGWDEGDWTEAGIAGAAIGGTAVFDRSIRVHVQAHRTVGEDRFMKRWQNFGRTWAFGVLGAFEVWGEVGGDSTAKDVAMDGLSASIIGPGIVGTTLKEVVGRVRPNAENRTYEFKPFSGNMSFPSGDAFEAFTVATAISEHYPTLWVQTLCYGTAGIVGYARIEQNRHHASDVVAGAILGYAITRVIVHRHERTTRPRLSWAPFASGTTSGVVFFKSF